jgi:hypothetical protein
MTPYQLEQLEVLRRIAERGKRAVEHRMKEHPDEGRYLDLFVHMLDEIERTKCSATTT